MRELGVATPGDGGSNGDAIGAFFAPMSLDPTNMTRSDSRDAYINDNIRPNLHLRASSQVTRLVTQETTKGIRVVGVEVCSLYPSFSSKWLLSWRQYATNRTSPRCSITVDKEVILSAGAVHTPQILQLSGIGDKSTLLALGINVIADLPGVGSNFQDHIKVPLTNTSMSLP